MKKQIPKQISTQVEACVDKAMYDYGCVFMALAEDDIKIIERCEKEGHKAHRKKNHAKAKRTT